VDGLLSFWVLSTIFAIVGTALKGLIRPISWATLAIATLFIAPGKMTETVNAVRSGEVKLAIPSLPPPPPVTSTAANPGTSTDPVPLDPNAATSPSTITTPPASPIAPDNLAEKGWSVVDLTAQDALPTTGNTASATTDPATTDSAATASRPAPSPTTNNNPPVSGLW
jgi:hypothetical protein